MHLLEQAARLAAQSSSGPPRQVDIRRAISAAYYGVFHALLTAAADHFVGVTKRGTSQYVLVYRSVDHGRLVAVCEEAQKTRPSARFQPYAPAGGFSEDMAAFARLALELQEKRHSADYDPMISVTRLDAFLAVQAARSALIHLSRASGAEREIFLTLLLFPPRR